MWLDIEGREQIRVGRAGGYYVRYGNAGNVDVEDVLLWLDASLKELIHNLWSTAGFPGNFLNCVLISRWPAWCSLLRFQVRRGRRDRQSVRGLFASVTGGFVGLPDSVASVQDSEDDRYHRSSHSKP